jgi:glucokinase
MKEMHSDLSLLDSNQIDLDNVCNRTNQPKSILGLDVGGTKIAIVEGVPNGDIIQRHEIPTEADRPFKEVLPRIIEIARDAVRKAADCGRQVSALSVSVGGPLRIRDGILLNPPHLPGWHNVRLKEELQQRFPELRVCIEHDGNAGALAEFWFGAGRDRPDLRNLVFLTFGTGLGAGLILNGEIVHGATDTAGEFGHWRLCDEGPVGFGKAGSWEGFASGSGLVQLASRMFPSRWRVDSPIRLLIQDMQAGEEDATAVLTEAARWMGRGLALIVDALNPEIIVLGSLAVLLGDRVLAPARAVVMEECLPEAARCCEIRASKLGMGIGDVAALMAALTDPVVGPEVLGTEGLVGASYARRR